MIRLFLCLALLSLVRSKTYGQITIYQDQKGQVFTRGGISPKAYLNLPYRDSPFLSFPIWQKGTIWLDEHSEPLPCELAYNLVSNEVLCRFPGDSTVKTATPEVFVVNGTPFFRQQNKLLSIDYRLYTTPLHDGPTKLLLSLTKRIERYSATNNGYTKEMEIGGAYILQQNYYIRKGDAKPELILLTKNSVLAVLHEQADKLAKRLPAKRLTTADVVTALVFYDSLMRVDWLTKPSLLLAQDSASLHATGYVLNKAVLSNDPLFNQTLYHKISYPSEAWRQGIYSRVYAGFEIDPLGQLKNLVILSPTNVGMGFVESVRNGLEKMPVLAPSFTGSYVLPVSFTFTNSLEHAGAHVPSNRLPTERLGGRKLLEEFVVPVVVSKPPVVSREVWGYYP